ncbi:23217_t:CDS:2 [Cetraspora pellucida]|uniref:23217_t:CDS:1 n=1 Tax=Cetraspora pellucida TaxID=1433469 RepID=A0A9N8ZY94_9GLOM|nr:23217_t:CDS:2 [Cetraspora pellucida]
MNTDNIDNNENLASVTPRPRLNTEGRGSDTTSRRSFYLSNQAQSPAVLKKQLQDQLNENADLAAALVKQQSELQDQIKALDSTEGNEVPQELKNKLADLEKEAGAIHESSAKVLLGSKSLQDVGLESPNTSTPTTPSIETTTPTQTIGKSSSRRDRNAQKGRQKDIEFATEIGQGLLQEVRRLQALLHEKEERIKELEAEKAELERTIEQLNKNLRANQESKDRLNEQVWALELAKQDLSSQLEDLHQQLTKARSDYTKIEKALSTATDVIEQLKDKEERLTSNLENLKTRHEKDMANNRRHIAALNREKADLLKIVDDLKSQLDSFVNASKIKKSTKDTGTGSNNISYDEDGQIISSGDTDSSIPQDSLNKNVNSQETMKALGVANRMIGSLRANLQKEKSEKYELKKLLSDREEQIEAMRVELYDALPDQSKQGNLEPGDRSIISENYLLSNDLEKINKDNRPSSSWFNKAKNKIKAARRDEAFRKLDNSTSRGIVSEPETFEDSRPRNSDLRYKDSVVRRRVTEYEDISKQNDDDESIIHRSSQSSKVGEPRSPSDEKRRTNSGNSLMEGEYESSTDSFATENESNIDSKRGSAKSKRETNQDVLSYKIDSSPTTRSIPKESTIIKTFVDVGVQTESKTERSDSMSSKLTFGTNRDTMISDNIPHDSKYDQTSQTLTVPDNGNKDNKRFTLDLSSSSNNQQSQPPRSILQNTNKQQGPIQSLDPPPRPANGPSATLIQRLPAAVNFGQQAGTPKVQKSLDNARKSSAESQDGILTNGKSRGINNINAGEPTTSRFHDHSSSSVSTSSSASITADTTNSKLPEHNGGPLPGPSGTDPTIIHAITQTMIGEYLWKYTRRNFGSDKRHKRFFWVHPYTKTLYWSNRDPGNSEPVDPKTKSGTSYFAYIESVKQVEDNNPSPPGLHHMSLIIRTPERDLKITARSKERHDYWYQALKYLLQQKTDESDKVNQGQGQSQGQTTGRPGKMASDPWDKQPNTRSLYDSTSPTGSLKGGNLKKKSSFNKIQSIFRRQDQSSSPLSSEVIDGQSQQLTVPGTQCCDGRHDVSKLERAGTHKGHNHHF